MFCSLTIVTMPLYYQTNNGLSHSLSLVMNFFRERREKKRHKVQAQKCHMCIRHIFLVSNDKFQCGLSEQREREKKKRNNIRLSFEKLQSPPEGSIKKCEIKKKKEETIYKRLS